MSKIQFMEMLEQFHLATSNNWSVTPKFPDEKRASLRTHLVVEEALEFEKACKENDMVEAIDGLIDLLYVTFGSLGEFGITSEALRELIEEIHNSNMSKVCRTEQEAIDTVDWYAQEDHPNRCKADYLGLGGKVDSPMYYVVFRQSDLKTLKNKYYKAANLLPILEKHGYKGN